MTVQPGLLFISRGHVAAEHSNDATLLTSATVVSVRTNAIPAPEQVAVVPEPGAKARARTGFFCALSAYVCWGFIPLYFHAVSEVPPVVVLCHRVFWSVLFLVGVISMRREWSAIRPIVRRRRSLKLLSLGAALMAINWLVFIYAVMSKQVLQASLGYFINPLLSIFLGMIFLGERLRRWQWLAVGIAAGGVANLALRSGGLPWIALSLAGSFGSYGLVRKKVDIDSLHGLFVETMILLLPAFVVVLLPVGHVYAGKTLGLLSLSGIVTAVPLIFFGAALRRLKLSTMGFLQYAGPTLQFLVAVVLFREPLSRAKLISFGLCWLAIVVYATDSVLASQPQPVADEPE
jgi:chloramphenicol-sensitive protein RarD